MDKKTIKNVKDNEGNLLKASAFMIEDSHPVVGRILIVDDKKYKILDDVFDKKHGTFIKVMTERDEELIKEYDEEIDELSQKLIKKVDLKKMIKEQIKGKTSQEIKTGLYILKKEKEGKKIEVEHHKGCYHFKLHYKNQEFDFASGNDVIDQPDFEIR